MYPFPQGNRFFKKLRAFFEHQQILCKTKKHIEEKRNQIFEMRLINLDLSSIFSAYFYIFNETKLSHQEIVITIILPLMIQANVKFLSKNDDFPKIFG